MTHIFKIYYTDDAIDTLEFDSIFDAASFLATINSDIEQQFPCVKANKTLISLDIYLIRKIELVSDNNLFIKQLGELTSGLNLEDNIVPFDRLT